MWLFVPSVVNAFGRTGELPLKAAGMIVWNPCLSPTSMEMWKSFVACVTWWGVGIFRMR